MTPEQEANAALVTAEVAGYADQLVPGAVEHLGKIWGGLASRPAEARAEEIARRMEIPPEGKPDLIARFRNPAYDPESDTDPVRTAIGRQGHKLRDGAADELAGELRVELAGRPAPVVAREVARHIAANPGYLKNPPAESPRLARVRALVGANFPELGPAGVDRLVAERGQQLGPQSDAQLIMNVAVALGSSVVAERYGTTRTVPADDARRRGVAIRTVTVTRPAPAPAPAPARDDAGKFAEASKPAGPPKRRILF